MTALQYQLINKIMTSEVIDSGLLDDAAELIVTSLLDGLEIHRAGIWLYHDQHRNILKSRLIIDRFHQLRDTTTQISRTQFPRYFAALDKEIVIKADHAVSNPLTLEFTHGYLDQLNITSMLDAPIRINGKTVGVVCCEQIGKPLSWSEDGVLFAGLLADKFGRALAAEEKIQQYNEFRKTSQAFVQQTDHLQALYESLDRFSLIARIDLDGNITKINNNFLTVSEYQREQVIGRPYQIFNCTLNPANLFSRIWHRLKSGKIWQGKICQLKRGGAFFWVEGTISPVKNRRSQIDGYIGFFYDITHEVEMENQLHEAEKLAKMGNFRCNIDTQQWGGSANFKKMFGLSEHQHITWSHLQDKISSSHFALLKQASCSLANDEKLDLTVSVHADKPVWLHFAAQRLGNWFMGSCQDISLQVEQKNKLGKVIALQKTIFDSANFTVIATTEDGIITHYNKMAEKLLGYTAQEVIHKQTPVLFHLQEELSDYAEELTSELEQPVAVGFTTLITKPCCGVVDEREWTYLSKEGKTFPVSLSVTAIIYETVIVGYLLIGKDLSQQKMAEKYSQQLSEIMTTAGDIASFSGFLYDVNSGEFQITNQRFRNVITSITHKDKIVLADLLYLCTEEEKENIAAIVENSIHNGVGCDFQFKMKDLEALSIKWSRVVGNPQIEKGKVTSILGFFQDVSVAKELQEKLSLQALTDELTRIPNRRALMGQLDAEWKRNARYQGVASVLIIDVDHFKKVNDRWGHDAGDFVLKALSTLLSGRIRESDIFGRFGGEEFLLLIPNSDEQGAVILAEQLRQVVEATPISYTHPLQTSSVTISISISIGVCGLNNNDIKSVNQWLVAADKCLYYAKDNGRNRVITYSDFCGG